MHLDDIIESTKKITEARRPYTVKNHVNHSFYNRRGKLITLTADNNTANRIQYETASEAKPLHHATNKAFHGARSCIIDEALPPKTMLHLFRSNNGNYMRVSVETYQNHTAFQGERIHTEGVNLFASKPDTYTAHTLSKSFDQLQSFESWLSRHTILTNNARQN